MTHNAFIPNILEKNVPQTGRMRSLQHAMTIAAGVMALAVLAQVSLPLPFTPVPITGQTFGVALIGLLCGRRHAVAVTVLYFSFAALGIPILASARTLLPLGPTVGYLLGMIAASYVIGALADRGWSKKLTSAFAACLVGRTITFSFGLAFLSVFIDQEQLLVAGLFPFIPGDLLKSSLAAIIASRLSRSKKSPRDFC